MFSKKVVVITGASSGIGFETALEFAKLEAELVLTGRNEKNLLEVTEQCSKLSPKFLRPLYVVADLNKEMEVETIIKKTIEYYKKIDVLINNAGIFESGSIETTSLSEYDKVMNTNVRGLYYLTMLAVPHLLETKGNIVNVSSIAGLRSFPNILAYCMSKAALDQFTRCVSLELAPKGIRVNAINPGFIKTNIHIRSGMSQAEYEAFMEKAQKAHPIGRVGEAKEVASAIIFLASDGASNITGATLPVDGGRHAACPR